MKIYTKRGDAGKTDLLSGERVSKTNSLIEAYGTVDELSTVLGITLSSLHDKSMEFAEIIIAIQDQLHTICANLANTGARKNRATIQENHISYLEEKCDYYEEHTPTLRHFIIPGGTITASYLHHARAVCRRGERRILVAAADYEVEKNILPYINRLSDLLFLMARYDNHINGYPEQEPTYR